MSAPIKLLAFAALLALTFGTAAFAGSRIDVRPGESSSDGDAAMADEHGSGSGSQEEHGAAGEQHGAMAADPVRGLAVSDGGLTLDLSSAAAAPGERFDLAFRVLDGRGRPVRDFDVEHTKRMHVIVVRRDLTGFQHLHPRMRPDGTWTVPATLTDPGSYRVFADFAVDGTTYTLADDLAVDGRVESRELPPPADEATVDGLRVTRTGHGDDLAFEVTRDGRPVEIEDYLGAKGHLVALREGDLAFLHVHPHEDRLAFSADFPTTGAYRLFLQFKVDGKVHTAAFTEEVAR